MRRLAAILFATALLTAGCGDDDADPGTDRTAATSTASPGPAEEAVVVEITIAQGKVTPQGERVEVKVGQPVTLSVTSDAADEIHVHSDPEHSLDVTAGAQRKKLTFELETPGQVAVESHHLDATIVQLVVTP